jgi:hypothetical protein
MALALSDADLVALITLLRKTIAADRLPHSPRVRALKAVLDKLDPSPAAPGPLPPPKLSSGRGAGLSRQRGR